MAALWKEPLPYYVCGGVLAATATVLVARKTFLYFAAKKEAERRRNYPANTVILHQIGRGPYAPSMSPFPLKLETYLRMTKIPYQNEHSMQMSPKQKTPWITYNGEDYDDSQLIIEFLNKELGKDANEHLNKEQRAVARAFLKMTEENLYWVIALSRWVYSCDNYKFLKTAFPGIGALIRFVKKNISNQAHGQGIGRHSQEEIVSIGRKDLVALSDFLGTKPFLMGDQPCEEDCAIFGMLAQPRWHSPGCVTEKMLNEFENLCDYCERMRDRFWPDWDECNTAGGTKEAKE